MAKMFPLEDAVGTRAFSTLGRCADAEGGLPTLVGSRRFSRALTRGPHEWEHLVGSCCSEVRGGGDPGGHSGTE